jgi:acyl carrier protein
LADPNYSEEEIFARVSTILQGALGVERSRITRGSRLFPDLGAESLDLLDIRFRVDDAFSLKIKEDELLRNVGEGLSAEEIEERLTVGSIVQFIQNRLQGKTG